MLMEPRKKLDIYIDKVCSLQQDLGKAKEDERRAARRSRIRRIKLYHLFKEFDKEQRLLQQRQNFQILLSQIKEFLRTISIKGSDIPSGGNSARFLQKLATIEGYSTLEAKIRKTIVILTQIREENLIYNSQIQQHLEEQKSKKRKEHATIITLLEQTFRQFITRKLMKASPNWWITKVPGSIRKKAEKTKGRDRNSEDQYTQQALPIDYVDFIDYVEIIIESDNWNTTFKEVFGDKNTLLSKFNELKPIRDAIMHSRELSANQIQRLQLYSDDLIGMIQKSTP